MTVKELIKELRKHNPDAEIVTEGCDCEGEVVTVTAESRLSIVKGKTISSPVVSLNRS